MSSRFFPGRIDYEGTMALDFNAGRAVSRHAQEVWRSVLEPYLGGGSRVLDVASGTGRFTILLAQWFGATVTTFEQFHKIAADRDSELIALTRPSVSSCDSHRAATCAQPF